MAGTQVLPTTVWSRWRRANGGLVVPRGRKLKLQRTSTQPRTMRHAVVPTWLGGILELDCAQRTTALSTT